MSGQKKKIAKVASVELVEYDGLFVSEEVDLPYIDAGRRWRICPEGLAEWFPGVEFEESDRLRLDVYLQKPDAPATEVRLEALAWSTAPYTTVTACLVEDPQTAVFAAALDCLVERAVRLRAALEPVPEWPASPRRLTVWVRLVPR